MLVNIGATEDDGMRSVREERERGRSCGGEHLAECMRARCQRPPSWRLREKPADVRVYQRREELARA